MNFTFAKLENVTSIKMLSASSIYGIGLITAIVLGFCCLFGAECGMYDQKIEKAKNSAAKKLIKKAEAVGANGIMDVKIQVFGTTVFMSGIAYK